MHCTPSCTGHCSVGVGGVCVAPRVVQGDRVVPQVVQHIAWVGIALHPKMYRAIRCVYGGGGVFALHPKLYRTLQGEGELHCTLSHAGELRCTPGHAGYCLGGGGGIAPHPKLHSALQRGWVLRCALSHAGHCRGWGGGLRCCRGVLGVGVAVVLQGSTRDPTHSAGRVVGSKEPGPAAARPRRARDGVTGRLLPLPAAA